MWSNEDISRVCGGDASLTPRLEKEEEVHLPPPLKSSLLIYFWRVTIRTTKLMNDESNGSKDDSTLDATTECIFSPNRVSHPTISDTFHFELTGPEWPNLALWPPNLAPISIREFLRTWRKFAIASGSPISAPTPSSESSPSPAASLDRSLRGLRCAAPTCGLPPDAVSNCFAPGSNS